MKGWSIFDKADVEMTTMETPLHRLRVMLLRNDPKKKEKKFSVSLGYYVKTKSILY